MQQPNTILMRAPDVCDTLRLGKSKLWELVANDALPVVRIGRAVRFRRSDVEAFVAALAADSGDAEDGGGDMTHDRPRQM